MRFSARRAFQLIIVASAIGVALYPPGSISVERFYARWLYPALQASLTALSNRAPIALFDAALILATLAVLGIWTWSIRLARKKRSPRAIGRGVMATLTLAAIAYLWFLAAWGLNYARPALETQMPFDASRITPQAVRALAEHAVREANRTHAAAHAAGFPAITDSPAPLVAGLHAVEREFGRPRPTVVARPKWSLLSPYYRAASVSGQLAPFFLETLVNPALTGPERPYVLAHEWAHLSGYAPEDDASFVGLLAAMRAGPAAEYSAWLELAFTAVNQLHPVTQKLVLADLAPGPRDDQAAIHRRVMGGRIEAVDRVAWATYDQMLKSQGVEGGVQSYSRVIRLVLGTNLIRLPSN